MKKPVIGITANFMADIPDTVKAGIAAPGQPWLLVADDYVQAVKKAGGVPVILPVHVPFEEDGLLDRLDGVLISGGNDVSPMLYGERFSPHCGLLDPSRDEYEISLTRAVLKRGMPLLGICRGLQVLNVALGGTLHQDLPSGGYQPHSIWAGDRNTGTHRVNFPSDSPLRKILGAESAWVNSFHHQAVKQLAPELRPGALSDGDGLVESAYVPGARFALAVQWHPEMMYKDALQAQIFEAFAAACDERS